MNFEKGTFYRIRADETSIAKVIRWNKKGTHFKCRVSFSSINFTIVIYNEIGNAVWPKDPAYDLMQRVKIKDTY